MWYRALFFSLSVFGCHAALAGDTPLRISDAWVREAPPNQEVRAAYMRIYNDSPDPRRITGASSSEFRSVEIHRTVIQDGLARMVAQPEILIPAHGEVVLKPGGYHLMLIGPLKPLGSGGSVTIRLQLGSEVQQTIEAQVRQGDGSVADHEHHHN
jgi:hypothetical protein